jgi:indolepyruvate ferredoxin oxidoreductase beta subunit
MALAGCHSVADFQDVDYVTEYLEQLKSIVQKDAEHGGVDRGYSLSVAAAKYIANAMVYDDVIRVADLKTRAARFSRIRTDIGVSEDEVLYLTEYFHPRAQEVCAMFPVRWGRLVESSPRLFSWLDQMVNRGRRIRTDNVLGFMQLYMIAGLRRWRRRLLRHAVEQQHMQTWLESVLNTVSVDYDLAVEMIRCRRLVKGYSDTHARTLSKFDRVMTAAIDLRGLADAADRVRRLCASAMQEEDDGALEEALHALKRVH